MKIIKLEVPIPLSVNHIYGRGRDGHTYLKTEAKRWKEDIARLAMYEKAKQNWEFSCTEKLILEYIVFWKDNRRHDVSNLLKLIEDSLQDQLYKDDKWLLPRCMDFSCDPIRPRVEIKIYPFLEKGNMIK